MLARSLLICAASGALGLALAGPGQSASGWRLKHGNGQIWAEASSLSHGATLSLQCDEANASISLTLEPPASWNGDAGYAMRVQVDGTAFPVIVDGTDDGVVLSNLPNDAIGIDKALRLAMKTGRQLVVEGPPATGIPLGQRSFPLAGADKAIARIEASCPGVR